MQSRKKRNRDRLSRGGAGQSNQARHTHINLFPLGNVVHSSAEDTDEDTDDDASERTVVVVGITINTIYMPVTQSVMQFNPEPVGPDKRRGGNARLQPVCRNPVHAAWQAQLRVCE